jgi:hypothetical protein
MQILWMAKEGLLLACQILDLNERSSFELSLLIENIQRKTLYLMEEVQTLKRYVSDFG